MTDDIDHIINNPLYRCRVCGLIQLDPPWGEDGETPTFNICECCGAEFGYEDCQLSAILNHRQKWLVGGAKWWWRKAQPHDWDIEEQLSHIPPEFR